MIRLDVGFVAQSVGNVVEVGGQAFDAIAVFDFVQGTFDVSKSSKINSRIPRRYIMFLEQRSGQVDDVSVMVLTSTSVHARTRRISNLFFIS